MEVDCSRRARAYIRERGRKLFVWFTPAKMSTSFLKQHVSTRRPRRVMFETFEGDGFTVHLDTQLEPPKLITIRLFWPGRLRVIGTGVGTVSFAEGGGG